MISSFVHFSLTQFNSAVFQQGSRVKEIAGRAIPGSGGRWKTVAQGQNPACHLLFEIKFYWNTVMPLVYLLSIAAFSLDRMAHKA